MCEDVGHSWKRKQRAREQAYRTLFLVLMAGDVERIRA
jgi:hypothetical protein